MKTVESITWTQSGTATSATQMGAREDKAGVWDVCVCVGPGGGGGGGGTKSEDCILQNPLPSNRRGPASAMNSNNNNKGGGVSRLNSSHIPSS